WTRWTWPSTAARRVGAGRAAQVGYTDTWRWRMLGAGDAPARHRDWWSRVVASAAYLSAGPSRPAPDSLTAAPYAALVAALGPPVAAPPPAPAIPDARLSWWWFALVAGALLAEWASRRMRGAR
ncbi:MAG TPA: hypothetical protein VKA84_09875, partial [Gemmatimonadaceae bacterium]|nr:hypothetical protein [Gemmatimonadaceae bacterium]